MSDEPFTVPESARIVRVDATYNHDASDLDFDSLASGTEVAMVWITHPRRHWYWLRHIPYLRRWATITLQIDAGDTITAGDQITATVTSDGWFRI